MYRIKFVIKRVFFNSNLSFRKLYLNITSCLPVDKNFCRSEHKINTKQESLADLREMCATPTPTPRGPNSLIFMQFQQKNC